MFERYTEAARRALFFSRYEVSQRGGSAIESYHLLLGLIHDSNAPITDILGHFQVTTPTIYREIDARTARHEAVSTSVEIPFSKGLQDVYTELEERRIDFDTSISALNISFWACWLKSGLWRLTS